MKTLKPRLQQKTQETGSRFDIVEKDYALSYVLAGIVSIDELKKSLVFKGGTALKKCYFGDYRFSEDLDFSTIDCPKGEALEQKLQEALKIMEDLLSEQGAFEVKLVRHIEQEPHPFGQEAFDIYIQYPWHRSPLCRLKVEITHDEPVLLQPPALKPIIHEYGEPFDYSINCYQLEEVVCEKLRSMLQTRQRFLSRASKRPRARDYYDLWRIFNKYESSLDKSIIKKILPAKCQHREVSYTGIDEFFTPELLTEIENHWEHQLGYYVQDLPPHKTLLEKLKVQIQNYVFE
jgi:predicted nucleotidyltransferase component of viral defense system